MVEGRRLEKSEMEEVKLFKRDSRLLGLGLGGWASPPLHCTHHLSLCRLRFERHGRRSISQERKILLLLLLLNSQVSEKLGSSERRTLFPCITSDREHLPSNKWLVCMRALASRARARGTIAQNVQDMQLSSETMA